MVYQDYVAIADHIRAAVGEAEIGVILGSGLGDYVEALQDAKYIDYKDIPGFPQSTVPGHAGRWWTGSRPLNSIAMSWALTILSFAEPG